MPCIDGQTLRAWRRTRGWDVPETARQLRRAARELGQPVAAHDGLVRMIYAWERGDHKISERYELLYDAALGRTPADPPEPPSVRQGRDFTTIAETVTSLLDVLGSYPPELPARISSAAVGATRVDSETADGLAHVMLGYRQIYQAAGAVSLLDPVCGTLALLAELAPGAGAYRQLIVSLIGQAGSLAATMLMLDQGDFAGAARYLAIAARAARQAGDDELMAITLAARGFHSAYSGDPADGLAFAREAVGVAAHGVHPRTHGWVAAVESEMHATIGDQVAFMRSIETAAAQLARPMPEGQWKGIGAFSEAKLTAYRGAGLMRLRRYSDAQATLLDALAQLDPMYAKHRCTAHIDLAAAFAHDGKPDEAADQAGNALDIIAVTRHAENLRRVGIIHDTIKPFGTAAIRDLGSRILEARVAL
jgi:hypothetical protein